MPFYNLGLEGYVRYFIYAAGVLAFLLSVFWRPIAGIYYLVPLLPLQTIRYRMNALPLGESVVYFMLLGVAIGLLRTKQSILPKTPWTRLLCIYVPFTFISLCIGSAFLGSPIPMLVDDRRFSDWCASMTMPALFLLVAASVRNVRQMKVLVVLMCLAVLMLNRAFWSTISGRDFSAYSEELHQEGGPMGFVGSNGLAAFEAQFAIFLLAMAALERKHLWRLGYLGLASFSVLCLTHSLSRGGYAAFLGGWLFIGLVKQRKLLLLLAVFAMVWSSLVPNAVRTRVEMTYDPYAGVDPSSEARLELWEDALKLAHANLLLGTGFNTYGYTRRVRHYGDTHNIYLEILVETGVVGLLLFLWLLGKTFHCGYVLFRRAEDSFVAGLGLGLAGWVLCAAVANFFGDRWNYLQIQGFLWVIAGLVSRAWALQEEADSVEAGTSASGADAAFGPVLDRQAAVVA